MGNEGFIIEQKGPSGWYVIGAGGLIGLALVIIGLALFNLATWAGCWRIGGRSTPPFYHKVLDMPECCGNCGLFYLADSLCQWKHPPLPVRWDYKCDVYRRRDD